MSMKQQLFEYLNENIKKSYQMFNQSSDKNNEIINKLDKLIVSLCNSQTNKEQFVIEFNNITGNISEMVGILASCFTTLDVNTNSYVDFMKNKKLDTLNQIFPNSQYGFTQQNQIQFQDRNNINTSMSWNGNSVLNNAYIDDDEDYGDDEYENEDEDYEYEDQYPMDMGYNGMQYEGEEDFFDEEEEDLYENSQLRIQQQQQQQQQYQQPLQVHQEQVQFFPEQQQQQLQQQQQFTEVQSKIKSNIFLKQEDSSLKQSLTQKSGPIEQLTIKKQNIIIQDNQQQYK